MATSMIQIKYNFKQIILIIGKSQRNMNTTKQVPNYDQIQDGVTWIGGPSHELQRQHIPGYQGHIHGLFAENVYGKNFARVTSQCMNNRNEKGIDHSNDNRYSTSYQNQFGEPDNRKKQFITTAEALLATAENKQKALNQSVKAQYTKVPKSIEEVAPIDRLPVVGYMGYKPVYRPPRKQVKPPVEPSEIKLQEREILEEMVKTGNGDQKFYLKANKQEPIVGYTGFLPGVKAQNQYAQVYKTLASNAVVKR